MQEEVMDMVDLGPHIQNMYRKILKSRIHSHCFVNSSIVHAASMTVQWNLS